LMIFFQEKRIQNEKKEKSSHSIFFFLL